MPLINVSDFAILGVQSNNRGRTDHNFIDNSTSRDDDSWDKPRGHRGGSRGGSHGHGKGGKGGKGHCDD